MQRDLWRSHQTPRECSGRTQPGGGGRSPVNPPTPTGHGLEWHHPRFHSVLLRPGCTAAPRAHGTVISLTTDKRNGRVSGGHLKVSHTLWITRDHNVNINPNHSLSQFSAVSSVGHRTFMNKVGEGNKKWLTLISLTAFWNNVIFPHTPTLVRPDATRSAANNPWTLWPLCLLYVSRER